MASEHAAHTSPAATADSLKPALLSARDELIADTRLARGGLESLARYSAHLDELIRRIYRSARACTDTPLALVAVGGYGRQQLCLHSDIDLLILFGGPIDAAEERFLKSMLHPLWDLHLDVGHHVRELSDLQKDRDGQPRVPGRTT